MKTNEAPGSDDELGDPSPAVTCPFTPAERADNRQTAGGYQLDRDDPTPEEAGYGYGV